MNSRTDTEVPRPVRLPPLLPPAAALTAGILAAKYFPFFPYTSSTLCIAWCALLIIAGRLSARAGAAAVIFMLAGFAAYNMYGPGAPSYASSFADAGKTAVRGVVTRPAQDREGYTVVLLKPEPVPAGFRRAGTIRLSLSGTGLGVRYGDVLQASLELKEPSGLRNPGTFDWGAYAKENGVDAVGSARPENVFRSGNMAGPVMARIYAARGSLIEKAHSSLAGPAEAIFRAVILGDQGAVDQGMRDAFAASGTTHILSVSGSHVALLAGAVFFLIKLIFRLLPAGWALRLSLYADIKKLAAAAAIPATVLYCLISGSEPAAVRAAVMVCMFLVSVLFDRQNQVLNTLSAAAIAVLIADPSALSDISFRLSYMAVLFIALALDAARGLTLPSTGHRWTDGLARRTALSVVMSAAAIAGTAPLAAAQFNSFSYAALPANLALIPIAGALAIPLGLASCALDALHPGTALPLAWLNGHVLSLFYSVVRTFASLPHANMHPASPGHLVAAAYYAAALAALFSPVSPWKKAAVVGAAAAALFILPLLNHPRADTMSVRLLDTGQGDCALVRLPDGKTMVIDCGGQGPSSDPGRQALAPSLWNEGVRSVDFLVVSHPHPDHVSGLAYMVSNFPVGQIWEGGLVSDDPAYVLFREAAWARGVPRYVLPEKRELNAGGATLQSLNNASSLIPDSDCDLNARMNNRSLVLRLKYGNASFLFAGDVEAEAQGAMLSASPPLPLKSSVLKVPHHGSADACLPGFIEAVSPCVAVVPAGRNNRYGHPAPATVEALTQSGAEVFCTGRDGAVTIRTNGSGIEVRTCASLAMKPACGWEDECENLAKALDL